ncbi:MAG: hypothetical protein QXG00_07390 [Candidatus Woesearchaeota archaeon]
MELFDHLNNLTQFKKEADFSNDEVKKSYDKYMINRWISMVDFFIPIVNEINKYDISEKDHYNFYLSALPKRKYFFNYIKKKKDINNDEKRYLAHYFNVGKKEAEIYINILEEDEIQEILNIYRYNKNKMIDV